MRTGAPPLLPIFRSQMQADLLARLLLAPGSELSLTDLAEAVDASVAAVQREVSRLEGAGILVSRRVGNVRLVRADESSPLYGALAELVLTAFGPVEVAVRVAEGSER